MTAAATEREQFEAVLDELRGLLLDFERIGVGVVLVGGQVIALQARAAGGDGVIHIRTRTEVEVARGFSMEPDLLFDVDGDVAPRADAIPHLLRGRGFVRVKTSRWRKETRRGEVVLDLFVPPDTDEANNPAGFTVLPKGDVALLRPQPVKVQLSSGELNIAVPDPVGFLAMKLESKWNLRPNEQKDSFDIYAYVSMHGARAVADGLKRDAHEGPLIMKRLQHLFGEVNAAGVLDVLTYASTLVLEERALLAQGVVDLLEEVWNAE